jgi:hypothetical protein
MEEHTEAVDTGSELDGAARGESPTCYRSNRYYSNRYTLSNLVLVQNCCTNSQ